MNYQDIPFLIWAEDQNAGELIKTILGRRSNTLVESGTPDLLYDYLQKTTDFQCLVLHLSSNKDHIDEVIENAIKKCPTSVVLIFSFKSVTLTDYQKLIQAGAADVVIYDKSIDQVTLLEGLLRILNQRWILYRYLEREKKKMYEATVVTAYHEINQALTVIINAIGLFKLEIEQNSIAVSKLEKISDFLMKGTNRIHEILTKLKKIKEPVLKEYTSGVSMVCLDKSSDIVPVDKTLEEIFRETVGDG